MYMKACVNTIDSINSTTSHIRVVSTPEGTFAAPLVRREDVSTILETKKGVKVADLLDLKLQAVEVAKLTGMHENACPDNCNKHGACFDTGCRCNPGWTGDACHINVKEILERHKKQSRKRRSVELEL
jgi:hypothetical protein